MTEIQSLYQELILDHGRRPRNFKALPDATRRTLGHNPLCGDELMLHLKLKNNRIAGLSFEGHGCAISMASASLMTEALIGKTSEEAMEFFRAVHAMLMGKKTEFPLGKLEALAGVGEFPARVKCAALAWRTLEAALNNDQEEVSTE